MIKKIIFSVIFILFLTNLTFPNYSLTYGYCFTYFLNKKPIKTSFYNLKDFSSKINDKIKKILINKKVNNKKKGTIVGKIVDNANHPLISANIMLLGTKLGAASDFNGQFKITNVKPGIYRLKVSFIGYKSKIKRILVRAGKITKVYFKLIEKSFLIGGIKVTAKANLLPHHITTETNINSAQIEHYQATSVGDILSLVPGVQQTQNPGLNKTNQIAIRGNQNDALSAFGTKIIVDGMPESNNANMQFEALTGSKFGQGTIGRGIDLRTIPADNIKSISIITGLPSVKYGDFTNGIIRIETKIGARPNRLKIKNNPSTTEGNFGGGVSFGTSALSYNLNIARSQRDLRITGDEYTRYTGQFVYSSLLFNKHWRANYKLLGQVIDDNDEPHDLRRIKNYNHGFSISFNTWGNYKIPDNVSVFDYKAYIKRRRIDSKKSKLITGNLVTPEGDTLASYIGVLQNKGMEWTGGGEVNWNKFFFVGSYIHKILLGANIQYDANSGQGIVIDSVFNYYGINSKKRSYSFDKIPGQTLLSFYAEDQITGKFLLDFSLRLGFRYDMFRPYKFNLKGFWGNGNLVESHQGSFFSPRLNLILYFSRFNQLRLSVGKLAKSPPMSDIYPPEDVFRWRNPADSTIYYYKYNRTEPNLKGYQSTEFEISYDQQFFNRIGTSITAYYRKRQEQPFDVPQPIFQESNINNHKKVFYVDSYYILKNIGIHYSKGIEFTLRTAKIKPLNLNVTINGSYNWEKYPSIGYNYNLYPNESWGQYSNYRYHSADIDTLIGWTYPNSGQWTDRLQLNYYLSYTNRVLGLWVTLRAEQLVRKRYQRFSLAPVDYNKLSKSELKIRRYEESVISYPDKWLLSFNVSKSLFTGAEVSFYVNNFLDNPAIYRYYNVSENLEIELTRNPELFYGIEFSMICDKIFK